MATKRELAALEKAAARIDERERLPPGPPRTERRPKRGPRTTRGKAASSRNAIKHGLRSGVPVIPHFESFEEWKEFRDEIITSYAPEGRLETELAVTCASILWRKRRVANYETEMTAQHLDDIPEDMNSTASYGELIGIPRELSLSDEKLQEQVSRRMLATRDHMERVIRYESHLHRLWVQTHHELEALQAHRKGDRPSPLARFDVMQSPASGL